MKSAHKSWDSREDRAGYPSQEELRKLLESEEAWSRLLPLARRQTRRDWWKEHGQPLYCPRYHVKVLCKRKRKGVKRRIKKVYKEVLYVVNSDVGVDPALEIDEGLYLEALRIKGIRPVVDAVEAHVKSEQRATRGECYTQLTRKAPVKSVIEL